MNNDTHRVRTRIIVDIIIFFTVLFAPWWVIFLAVLGGIFSFKNFYEAFFAGFLFDTLYGVNVASAYGFRFFFSVGFLFFIFVAEFLKQKIRI